MPHILSLTYLRGIAALVVVYAHVVIVGTFDTTSAARYFPMIVGPAYPPEKFDDLSIFVAPELWLQGFGIGLNSGHIAVGAFFLLSGFLITAAVERNGLRKFAFGRFFRIVPVAAAVTIGSALAFSIYLFSRGYPTTYGVRDTFLSLCFLPAKLPVIPVAWSLIVEVWFYAVIAIAYYSSRRPFGLVRILGTTAACLVGVAILAPIRLLIPSEIASIPALEPLFWFLPYNLTFVVFIMAGVAVYRAKSTSEWAKGGVSVALILGMFWIATRLFDRAYPGALGFHPVNAVAAVGVFLLFLAADRFMPKLIILKFFADISYPLYLVHIPMAWLLLRLLSENGVSGRFSVLLVFGICIVIAYAVHRLIEVPSHRLGRGGFRSLAVRDDQSPERSPDAAACARSQTLE